MLENPFQSPAADLPKASGVARGQRFVGAVLIGVGLFYLAPRAARLHAEYLTNPAAGASEAWSAFALAVACCGSIWLGTRIRRPAAVEATSSEAISREDL